MLSTSMPEVKATGPKEGHLSRLSTSLGGLRNLRDRLYSLSNKIDGSGSADHAEEPSPVGLGPLVSEITNALNSCQKIMDQIQDQF